MSRPKGTEKPIDLDELEKLFALGCTLPEIAGWFGVSLSTLEKRMGRRSYHEAQERGQSRMKISLRRRQIQVAESGNPTMLIWLGKQHLNQRDSLDMQHSGADGKDLIPLAVVDAIIAAAKKERDRH